MPTTFSTPRAVRFPDVDASGALHFATALAFAHDAVDDFLRAHEVDAPALLASKSWAAPVEAATLELRRPIRAGEALTVELELAIRDVGFAARFTLRDEAGARAAAGHLALGSVEPATGRSVPLPAPLAAALGS